MNKKEISQIIREITPRSKQLRSFGCCINWVDVLKKEDIKAREYAAKLLYPSRFSAPLGVQFELTYRCNLRCLMCYNSSYRQTGKYELSDKEWLGVAEESAKLGIFECIISGGEPLLRRSLVFKIMDIMHDHQVLHLLISNGWLLDKSVASRLRKYLYRYIQVSIDGSRAEIHDRIRRVKGSWKRAINAAANIVSHGLPLCIAHTLTASNFEYLEEMIELAVKVGATQLVTDGALYTGEAIINRCKIRLPKNWEKRFYAIIESARKAHSSKITIMTSIDPAISMRRSLLEPTRAVLIRPNGNVKLGCMVPHAFGNVREKSLLSIWKSGLDLGWQHPEVLRFIRAIRTDDDFMQLAQRGLPIPHVDDDVLLTGYPQV